MNHEQLIILLLAFSIIALVYSSVGHAGASGYLAVMILLGIAPAVMRPTALSLNICVSLVVCSHLWWHKRIDWSSLWPFVIGSMPMAALGGALKLEDKTYLYWLAGVMIVSGLLVFLKTVQSTNTKEFPTRIHPALALVIGGLIGLLSGVTGTGGGIFLSPILVLFGLANIRATAAISAPFILLNSIAGLSGNLLSTQNLPPEVIYLVIAVAIAGYVGIRLGTHVWSAKTLLRILSGVMLFSASKILLG